MILRRSHVILCCSAALENIDGMGFCHCCRCHRHAAELGPMCRTIQILYSTKPLSDSPVSSLEKKRKHRHLSEGSEGSRYGSRDKCDLLYAVHLARMDHVMIFTYIVSHIAPRSHMLSMGSRVVEGSSVEARIFITTTCSNMISREFLNDKIRETSGTSPVHLCKSWCKRSWLELDQRVLECTSVSVVPNSCVHPICLHGARSSQSWQ